MYTLPFCVTKGTVLIDIYVHFSFKQFLYSQYIGGTINEKLSTWGLYYYIKVIVKLGVSYIKRESVNTTRF